MSENRAIVCIDLGLQDLGLQDLGLQQRAISDYYEALRLNPNFAESYNRRAVVHIKLGEPQAALDDLKEAVENSTGSLLELIETERLLCWQ